ncbi:MAG TPA: hypothetical protein VNO31_33150 [Umezawaea sp.]|nr:hypothetical protein [Umezawaea sp.]
MRIKELFLGRSTVEYRKYLRRERRLTEAGRKDPKESRWVAAEDDWPGHHSADVPDRKAAELIWSETFTKAGTQVQATYEEHPVSESRKVGENPT